MRTVDRETLRRRLVVAMVALLPLHTVFLEAWISWKPFLVLLIAVVAIDLREGLRSGAWPYDRVLTIATAVFGATLGVGVFITDSPGRFFRLLFAVAVGAAVMLVTERTLRIGDRRLVERAVVWSAAALAASAFLLSLVVLGAFGGAALDAVNDVPGVFRIGKAAYLDEGFVSLTNWHQDPGYAAAWMNLWAAIVLVLAVQSRAFGRWWLDGMVIGGLGYGTLLTMSRSGWLGWVIGIGVAAVLLVRGSSLATVARLAGIAALTGAVLLGAAWLADREGVGGDLGDQFGFRADQNFSLGTVEHEGASGDDGIADIRENVWPFYWDAFERNPVLGIGLGSGWAAPGIQEPHNLALQLLGESGLVGAAGFLVLAAVLLRRRRGREEAAIVIVALLPAFFQTLLFEPTWWFAAGVFVGGIGAFSLKPSVATVDE
jgi:hypothetical protein